MIQQQFDCEAEYSNSTVRDSARAREQQCEEVHTIPYRCPPKTGSNSNNNRCLVSYNLYSCHNTTASIHMSIRRGQNQFACQSIHMLKASTHILKADRATCTMFLWELTFRIKLASRITACTCSTSTDQSALLQQQL